MKSPWLVGGVIAVVCVALAIYYLIPGIYHPFTSSTPTNSHVTHAILFFGLAIVAIFGARFAANSKKP